MKFLNLNKVLCLSAHPDDVEYGVLGSMIKFGDTKFDVVVLSNGGDFDVTTGNSRFDECRWIWNKLNNINGSCLDFTCVRDSSEDFWVNHLENNFDIRSYDAILSLPEYDSHFEHRKVNNISKALLRGVDVGLITYRTPSTLEKWIPNYYTELQDEVMETKIDILREGFNSQKDKLYFQRQRIKDFHINYQCSKVGVSYVEQFKIERLFG